MKNNKAFTLVELIVVVTILALLWTIWFVSYSSYLTWIRDTNRIATLVSIHDSLTSYRTKGSLPLPEDSVDIKINWNVLASQWYVWENILDSVNFDKTWMDPKDDTYYSYYLTENRTHFQIMWFLEDEENLEVWSKNSLIVTNFEEGAIDYSDRFPTVRWAKLGILTDNSNTPIQELINITSAWKIELDTTNSWTIYSMHIDDARTYTFTWNLLVDKIETLSQPWIYGPPKECPIWFIPVWWDAGFNQEWFCVAKYEMTYEDADSADSIMGYPYNSSEYDVSKKLVSMVWKYPVANVLQTEAVDSCKDLWVWYHLIMNKEWMTIARQVELEPENWSSLEVWNWFLYNWISGDRTKWCDAKWWNTETRDYGTKTWPANNSCDERRSLSLFNWQEVWDMSWNLHEWVNWADTLDWTNLEIHWQACSNTADGWVDWISAAPDGCVFDNDYSKESYWALLELGVDNGGWMLRGYADSTKVMRRWFAADAYDATSIYCLHLNYDITDSGTHVGFRCAYSE